MGQGAGVDSQLRSIVVDICSKGGLLSILAASASLLATTTSAASLSLGRSISARTAIGRALLLLLLLLLGKLWVSQLSLHSAKLVGLWALTTAMSSTFLLEREHGDLHNSFWFEILDLIGQRLAENLGYNLHSRRELAKNDHSLHGGRKIEASVFEICGLDNISEAPEPRSTTSRNATRTGSPLTSLPASTPVMGERETQLHELHCAFYFTTPFSQGPYPPCTVRCKNPCGS